LGHRVRSRVAASGFDRFTPADKGHEVDMTDPTTRTSDETLGALALRLSEQIPELVRSELRLAQAELTQKGKKAGLGIGMFSAAGLLAFFGLATLITTAILALSLILPAWAAALIVAVVLFAGAGGVALAGRNKVQAATPATPERTIANVREDVSVLKGGDA
jgi:uncharacterized membrane protein YqjE